MAKVECMECEDLVESIKMETCPACERIVCPDCYDSESKICKSCVDDSGDYYGYV